MLMLLIFFVGMAIVNLHCLFFVEAGQWWIQKILCVKCFFQKMAQKFSKRFPVEVILT